MALMTHWILPSGTEYEIADAAARTAINNMGNFITAWNGKSEPVVANIPRGVVVEWHGQTYTGTLAEEDAQNKSIYLVNRTTNDEPDRYEEYIVAQDTSTDPPELSWESLGYLRCTFDELGNLAFYDEIELEKGQGDNVLGEGTTFNLNNPTVNAGATKVGLKAAVTNNGSLEADGTFNAVKEVSTTQKTVLKSAAPTKKKMKQVSIIPAGSQEVTVKSVKSSGVKKKKMNKRYLYFDVVESTKVRMNIVDQVPAGTEGTNYFSLAVGTLGTAAGDANDIVDDVETEDKSCATKGTAVDVADGTLVDTGNGGEVVISVDQTDTETINSVSEVQKENNVWKKSKIASGPTVQLQEAASVAGGDVAVVKESSPTLNNDGSVSPNSNDIVKVARYDDLDINLIESQQTRHIYLESQLSDEEVSLVLLDSADGRLKYVPLRFWSRTTVDPNRFTLKPFVRFHRGKNGRSVAIHARETSGMWAEFNRYRLYCTTSASGGFSWAVTINGTAKSGTVSWSAGANLDSIVTQLNTGAVSTYLVFSHESGEDFIRIRKGGYSNSTFTITNATGATLEDLSLYTKVNGELVEQAHRDWQSQNVETMFPDLGFVAANTAQYSVSGYNLSYMCGGNETRYKTYYGANGSSTYLAETSVSSRMTRAAFAAMNGSGVQEQQDLYDKYHGSWDAYMEASMAALDDTHTGGIEYQSYDNGDTQTSILVSITTMDFDGTYIPAYPGAANCRSFTDSLVYGDAFNMSTQHEIGVFMRDAKFEEINRCLDILSAAGITVNKLSRTAYRWSVARYGTNRAWFYGGNGGLLDSYYLSNGFTVRPLAYLN